LSENILSEIRGRTKAAVLLGFLPLDTSRKVISYLDNDVKEVITKELANMPKFNSEIVEAVVKEYLGFLKGNNLGMVNSGLEYVTKLLEGAVPDEELEEIMGRVYQNSVRPFGSLTKLRDISPLVTFLQGEAPQTIAVIASYLKPAQASELLQSLPEEKMVEVAMGIANMENTNKDYLLKIERLLNKKLESFVTDDQSQTDGVKTLVNILNNVPRSVEKVLFDGLDKTDEELSKTIKDNMFVFEDIIKLDGMSLSKVINSITDNDLIAMSLRVAKEELKEKFYQSMSEGRKRLVVDADEGIGRVRLNDVEEAQQKIAHIVKDLEKAGEIVLSRGEDDVIL
jgi:flagellar motor switch protein FliG